MLKTKIDNQRKLVQSSQQELDLLRACRLNDGIISLSEENKKIFAQKLFHSDKTITFFIPASGSGSRMFHFLFEFLEQPNETNRGYVERFLTHIEDFAFFHQFPDSVQQALRNRTMDLDSLVTFILNNKGYGLAHLPKGLIPFHRNGPFLLCPIQDHVIQGNLLNQNGVRFHFTIQPKFKEYIQKNLEYLEGMTSRKYEVNFSEQSSETDAIAFDDRFEPVLDDSGEILTRPAGHGALFENFKAIDSDLVFIKNIDNIQHFNHAESAIETQKMLGGLFLEVQNDIELLKTHFSNEGWHRLNEKYQLFHESIDNWSEEQKRSLLDRPLRVCGMVKNEGQPGGGPFWVENEGEISKQIIEKAQINPKGDQIRVMIQSSHFNPVMMVCQGASVVQDLDQYKDNQAYFKVNKSYQGQTIRFIELPGLWNGSMAKWNTVFVEIPGETFSPVKSILDLLEPAHQP